MEAALEPLLRQRIRLLAYLDNPLVLALSAELEIAHKTDSDHTSGIRYELEKEHALAQSSDCLPGITARH